MSMTFVFTGPAYYEGEHVHRDFLRELVNDNGHYVENKVTYHTDYLVVSPRSKTTTRKFKDAQNKGVSRITADSLVKLLEGKHGIDPVTKDMF